MDVYKEVFANLRSEMENFVQELDEGDADAMLQIVDGFASLSDVAHAFWMESSIKQAMRSVWSHSSQMSLSAHHADIDTQRTNVTEHVNQVLLDEGIADSDDPSPEAEIHARSSDIAQSSSTSATPPPPAPTSTAPPSASTSSSAVDLDPVDIPMPSAPIDQTRKRKRVKGPKTKPINLAWLKKELSPTAFDLFLHHIGHEEELLAEVKKRFQLVLSLERQQEENGIFDYEGIPQDLRTCVKLYLGSSMRRQAENYHGYVMACQIQKRVDDENKGETEAVKMKRYKEIFSVIAGNVAGMQDIMAIFDKEINSASYINKDEGKNDMLHCRKCKILADRCGLFVLVLHDVFSKNFITRLINDKGVNKDNIENIVRVLDYSLSKSFLNATIVNGEFTLAPEKASVIELD
ncbi:hypothetical protein MUCCIDRAFT_108202 [Mucor lusitanicus CBS 277.49]|uniref:Uncharacterized protein n=1 Tax=Mucor lusitanicus CBS 277.49 TaxID=747725 RepID=A0A168M4P4_MUCCL|nr:hypothetical protein MUCCIDRAFT_108202 [Mucor lusitanicus CBS 277.49]